MADKLIRFTVSVFNSIASFSVFVGFMFMVRALIRTQVVIFQVIAGVLILALLVSGLAGTVFFILTIVRKCNTRKRCSVVDPDELQL